MNESTKRKWTPIRKKMPLFTGGWKDRSGFDEFASTDRVLVVCEDGLVTAEFLQQIKPIESPGAWVNGEETLHKVTHWMPLPDPPKVKSQ